MSLSEQSGLFTENVQLIQLLTANYSPAAKEVFLFSYRNTIFTINTIIHLTTVKYLILAYSDPTKLWQTVNITDSENI